MPGVELQLTYPELGDTVTNVVSKTATALAAIAEDLADRVVVSELDMNATLSMEGNAISNVAGLQLTETSPTTGAGTLYYQDGELNVITAGGVVRITLEGVLDASSIGGITGLGGTDGAALFDNASNEFRFTHEPGSYADLRASDVILVGANGSIRLSTPSTVTTTLECALALPSSGVKPMAYDAGNSALVDATVTRETGTHLMASANLSGTLAVTGAASVGGDLTLSADIVHGSWVKHGSFTFNTQYTSTGTVSTNGGSPGVLISISSSAYLEIPVSLNATERIASVTVYFGDAVSAGTCAIYMSNAPGTSGFLLFGDATAFLAGVTSHTVNVNALVAVDAHLTVGRGLFVLITTGVGNSARPIGWAVTYTGI